MGTVMLVRVVTIMNEREVTVDFDDISLEKYGQLII